MLCTNSFLDTAINQAHRTSSRTLNAFESPITSGHTRRLPIVLPRNSRNQFRGEPETMMTSLRQFTVWTSKSGLSNLRYAKASSRVFATMRTTRGGSCLNIVCKFGSASSCRFPSLNSHSRASQPPRAPGRKR